MGCHVSSAHEAKETGMKLAAERNAVSLRAARAIAVYIAEEKGEVSMNDVRERLPDLPSGNYLGSVFKGKDWEFTGRWIEAKHESSHARSVRVWRLKGAVKSQGAPPSSPGSGVTPALQDDFWRVA